MKDGKSITFALELSLALLLTCAALSAHGQTVTACAAACECSLIDMGQAQFNSCMAKKSACLAACEPQGSGQSTESGVLNPKYLIFALIYAPPGCTSTSAVKCGVSSSVDYQNGSSNGTNVSNGGSFKNDVQLSATVGVGAKAVGPSISTTFSGGWTNTATQGNSVTITKSPSNEIKVPGNGDGVDHTQDGFVLLLNPAVVVRATTLNGQNPNNWQWNLGYTGGPWTYM